MSVRAFMIGFVIYIFTFVVAFHTYNCIVQLGYESLSSSSAKHNGMPAMRDLLYVTCAVYSSIEVFLVMLWLLVITMCIEWRVYNEHSLGIREGFVYNGYLHIAFQVTCYLAYGEKILDIAAMRGGIVMELVLVAYVVFGACAALLHRKKQEQRALENAVLDMSY